jgi:drug/metabolite transporter (DMT)-like permease
MVASHLDSASITATRRAYAALAGGVLCIGFAPIFPKLAHTTGDVISTWRLIIAALTLTILAAINWRRGRARLPRAILWTVLVAGIAFASDMLLWNTALTITTASTAALLGNTAPLWVALGAWLLLKDHLKPIYWVGLVIAMSGMALIMGVDWQSNLALDMGAVLSIGSGLSYAVYQLVTHRAREQADSLSYVWAFTVVAMVVAFAANRVIGHPLLGLPASSYAALITLALISHVTGWLLLTYAFGHLPASLLTVSLLGQPIIATIAALFILKEIPDGWHIAGGLITLIGIYVVHRSSQGA